MKKLVSTCIVLLAGLLFTNAFAQVQKPTKQQIETPKQLVLASDSTAKLTKSTVVPANQTYNVYDENGKLLGTYTEGQTVVVPSSKAKKKMDCWQVSCPKAFKKETVCWKCK